jgi:hypothetical protein
MKPNDLLHRPNDFVAVVKAVSQDGTRVDLAYYKWLPYGQPDNKISGMNGWYRVETMEQYLVSPQHSIFQRYGLPPEYVAPAPLADVAPVYESIVGDRIRLFAKDIAQAAYLEAEDTEAERTQALVDYVLGLLK